MLCLLQIGNHGPLRILCEGKVRRIHHNCNPSRQQVFSAPEDVNLEKFFHDSVSRLSHAASLCFSRQRSKCAVSLRVTNSFSQVAFHFFDVYVYHSSFGLRSLLVRVVVHFFDFRQLSPLFTIAGCAASLFRLVCLLPIQRFYFL